MIPLPEVFAVYITVYITVLLVSPFPGPTVAVTSFSGAPGRDWPRDAQHQIRRWKRRELMICAAVTLVIAAFLSGAVITAFAMLVAGIHAGDRAHRLTEPPHSRLQALTRTMLGVGVRTGHFSANRDGEKD